MELQKSRRFENDGGTQDPRRTQEKCTQTGDDTIRHAQVGRTLATAIEDLQLMLDQHRFGNHGSEAPRLC